jgi:hypothetical protein
MPSPFPGMDPYLEDPKLWPGFQHQFVACLYQILLPGLVDSYRARIACRSYESELALFTSVIREQHAEEYIEIRSRGDSRLVTLIDVVSPANKTTTAGRDTYLAVRRQAELQKASAVEIDLVTQGSPTLEFDRSGLPAYDQCIIVTRGSAPGRYEVYTSTFQKRLPKFKVPLAADDRDAMLDLQDVFRRAYDQGNFARQIDYTAPPPRDINLSHDTRSWLESLLQQQKFR